MNTSEERADEELLDLIAQGDADARDAFLDRYLAPVYDLALRVTLDPVLADEATLASFGRVASETSRPPQASTYAWLFGLGRDEALGGLRRRGRAEASTEDATALVSHLDEPFFQLSQGASLDVDAETLRSGWWAARADGPRDYALLDLAVRRGLAPEEVADVAGLSRMSVYATLGRLRGALEESFAAAVLHFGGQEACAQLAAVASGAEDLDPALQREIKRHAETCPICRETRNRYPPASDLLAAFADIEPPADLRERVLAAWHESSAAAQAALPLAGATAAAAAVVMSDAETAAEAEEPPVATTDPPDDAPTAADTPADEPFAAAVEAEARERSFEQRPAGFFGGVGAGPPVLALSSSGGGGRRRNILVVVVAVTLIASLLGVVVGAVLDDGGSADVIAPLPTGTPGVGVLACSGAATIEQGSRTTLTFEQSMLPGFSIKSVAVRAISANASDQSIDASVGELAIVIDALTLPGPAGRTDEYRLDVEFTRDAERVQSECTLRVRAPAVTVTATASVTPTETPPPPTATATAVIIVPSTPVPPAPTSTPVPPTETPTITPLPGTPTPAPTSTPIIRSVTPAPTLTLTPTPPAP